MTFHPRQYFAHSSVLVGVMIFHATVAVAQQATPSVKNYTTLQLIQTPALTKKMCTKAAKADWLSEEEFLILMKQRGYVVQSFKVVYESCYEVYGFDKQKRIIEAYFNPQNAQLNRQNFVSN